jgi:hypothetical protein
MDNGFELTEDGYVLHPKPSQYRVAAVVGIVGALLSLFVVGAVVRAWLAIPSDSSSARTSTLLVVVLTALFLGLMTSVGYLTSRPPTLSVTRSRLSLVGGAYRRRVDRSHVRGVTRGLAPHRDKTYSIGLDNDRRDIEIPLRHFDPAAL